MAFPRLLLRASPKVIIDYLEVLRLTPEDLRSSRLPEEQYNIWLKVSEQNNKTFTLVYSNARVDHPEIPGNNEYHAKYYPRVSLSAKNRTATEFSKLLAKLTDMNGGTPIQERPTRLDEGEYSALIHEKVFPFNQKTIADLYEQYRSTFKEASSPSAYFYNVPLDIVLNPGFKRSIRLV